MATLHKIDEIRMGPAREEVERLARQTGYVIAVAQKIYDAEYDKLSDAKVTDFVAVLAVRANGCLRCKRTAALLPPTRARAFFA